MIETTKAPGMSRGEVIGLCISGAGLAVAAAGLWTNIQQRKDAAKAVEEQKKAQDAAVRATVTTIVEAVKAELPELVKAEVKKASKA